MKTTLFLILLTALPAFGQASYQRPQYFQPGISNNLVYSNRTVRLGPAPHRALEIYRNNDYGVWPLGTYIGEDGEIVGNSWMRLSGTDGLIPASSWPSFLSIVPDINGPSIEVRGSYMTYGRIFDGMNYAGFYVMSILTNGTICLGYTSPWTNNTGTADNFDIHLSRYAAGQLAIDAATIFSNKVSIGLNDGQVGRLHLVITNYLQPFVIAGSAVSGPTNATNGVALSLSYNDANARQLMVGASDGLGSAGVSMARINAGSYFLPTIDGVTGNGVTVTPLNIGIDSATSGLSVGNSLLGYNTTLPGRFSIYGNNSLISQVIKQGAVPATNAFELQNSSGGILMAIDKTGCLVIPTVTNVPAVAPPAGSVRVFSVTNLSGKIVCCTQYSDGSTNAFSTQP